MQEKKPFKGLDAYDEQDARFFLGREDETQMFVGNLQFHRLTVIYGPSGVGKSSLLRAGVVSRLRQFNEAAGRHGKSRYVLTVFNSWQGNACLGLKQAIAASFAEQFGRPAEGPAESERLASFIERLQRQPEAGFERLLIILDQFEEYFAYQQYIDEEDGFAEEFAEVMNDTGLRVNFLVSIREEALVHLRQFSEAFDDQYHDDRIDPLARDTARQAVLRTIEEYNAVVSQASGRAIRIEPELLDAVLQDVTIHSGAVPPNGGEARIDAASLQIVLDSLWVAEREIGSPVLRLQTYIKLGRKEKILEDTFASKLNALPSREQEVAFHLFRYLVTSSGNKIALSAPDLVDYVRRDYVLRKRALNHVLPLLRKLSDRKTRILRMLLPLGRESKEVQYVIYHDVLGPRVKAWREQYKQLRSYRRTVWVVSIVTAAALFASIGSAFYYNKNRQTEEQRDQERQAKARNMELLHLQEKSIPYMKHVLHDHEGPVRGAAFSPDGSWLVTACEDGVARVWDAETGELLTTLTGHTGRINHVCISPDGKWIVTAGSDRTARVWDAVSRQPAAVLKDVDQGEVVGTVFSPDSAFLVTVSKDATARVWDTRDWHLKAGLRDHSQSVRAAAFSPDGKLLATASDDQTARVWKVGSWQVDQVLREHTGPVQSLAFSPDGQYLATASADSTVRLWATEDWSVSSLRGHSEAVNSVAFSPDSQWLVSASDDHSALVWNVESGIIQYPLEAHQGRVISATFSPGGERIITASADQTARVWELQQGQTPGELRHSGPVASATFSPQGDLALTSSDDSTARIWNLRLLGGLRIEKPAMKPIKPDIISVDSLPVLVPVSGTISATGIGEANVLYRFVYSNGATSDREQIRLKADGHQTVSTSWKVGDPSHPTTTVWVALQVTSPQEQSSERASFKIVCKPDPNLNVPKQLAPSKGKEFSKDTESIQLEWEAVPNATSYRVEVCYKAGENGTCQSQPRVIKSDQNKLALPFSGKRGLWRVWAVSADNHISGPSSSWDFKLTP